MPPAKIGLVYGHTGLRKFLDTVGLARTKELFLTGRNLEAARADQIGLVNEVVPDDSLERELDRAGGRDRRQRAALAARQQERDRHPQPEPGPQRRPGGRPDRPARVVLRLPGLPRGDRRLRREAKAASGGAGERQGGARLGRPGDGGPDRADRRTSTSASGCARRSEERPGRRLRRPAAGDRRPAALDQSGADDLPARARPLRRRDRPPPSSCWRRARRRCAAPASPAARSSTCATSPPT